MANLGPVELLLILALVLVPVVIVVLIVMVVNRRRPSAPTGTMQAGWWPDPNGAPNVVRYFDGQRWTDQTREPDPPAP